LTTTPPAIVVDFPLRGEWVAAHTPAERAPSHGTDQLGQRFAYDFLRIDRGRRGWKFYRTPVFRSLLTGVALEDCYGWSAPILAPFSGVVTTAQDGEPERNPVHIVRDLALVIKNAFTFNPNGGATALRAVLGKHVIVRKDHEEVYAFFAHARCGSVRVAAGQRVTTGQELAQVGHSGNSTAPHLHFHLMDAPDILHAGGLPCCFREYEALHDGTWTRVQNGLPGKREFVRCGAETVVSAGRSRSVVVEHD
jgi:murein DD-endopeptidase MepM/ murein hydrolase activator NlpD